MSSRSAEQFRDARASARLMLNKVKVPPTKSGTVFREPFLHACLTMLVAAWESYLERIVREIHRELNDPSDPKLAVVLSLLIQLSEKELKKFNTPNSENSRNLLYLSIGYDPINDWHWPEGGLNAIQARQRLDEILRVRHSFAHGVPIPRDITWARMRNRPGHLTLSAITLTERFLSHLVKATDRGISTHMRTVFRATLSW